MNFIINCKISFYHELKETIQGGPKLLVSSVGNHKKPPKKQELCLCWLKCKNILKMIYTVIKIFTPCIFFSVFGMALNKLIVYPVEG